MEATTRAPCTDDLSLFYIAGRWMASVERPNASEPSVPSHVLRGTWKYWK